VCCDVLQCIAVRCIIPDLLAGGRERVAVCLSVLQCVVMYCSVSQCAASYLTCLPVGERELRVGNIP